ncbi:MAG: ABC transporter substrate-binding protein [Deltaproteobacteria bacterium]|nr:ABC transporter substrate-binding protein [Deltaproteobacteria bacterium]
MKNALVASSGIHLRLVLGLLLLLSVIPKASPAAQLYVVWTSEAGVFAPLWVTKEAKLFEKHGNQVQLIFIQGATLAASALISGDAQVGYFSPQVVVTSTLRGQDLVMLARMGDSVDNRIFGRKGIADVKRIKSLAISRFGSSADFVGRVLLERSGLKPDVDVAFLQFGNQSNRLAAIEAARADAAIVTPPMTLQARKMGFPLLLDGSKLGIPYSSNMIVVRRSYLERDRDALRNFMKAVVEGIHYFKANREFSLKVISKYMKISDREIAEETFREYDFPLKPYPAREYFELPIQEVGRREPRALKENPERFTDASLVKDLDESGFIDRLAREYGLK